MHLELNLLEYLFMNAQTNIPAEVKELFDLGAHLGHKKNRLHPKAKKYVYRMVEGVSVIDLTKSVEMLKKAKEVLKNLAKEEKVILVVATKKISSALMTELGKKHEVSFMTSKWLPGLLTNFDTIIKNVHKLNTMRDQEKNGDWEQFVKHERMKMSKEIAKLDKLYGGLTNLKKKPDALLVLDIKKEKNAVNEAKQNNIPVIAVVDTNSNPDEVAYPIMLNDDASVVIEYVMTQLLESYTKGKATDNPKTAEKKAVEKVVAEPAVEKPAAKAKEAKPKTAAKKA